MSEQLVGPVAIRRRFLEALEKLHHASQLKFFGEYAGLTEASTFSRWLAPLPPQDMEAATLLAEIPIRTAVTKILRIR